jgi:thioredoxin-like negative regulator of GroEL
MGLFARRPGYDRSRVLAAAAEAVQRKRRGRAITLYRRVLAVEPDNGEIHAKIAPLLAQTGRRFEAWVSFRSAARTYASLGRRELALSVLRAATLHLPRELAGWEAIADLQREKGRRAEAVRTLLEARRQFRRRNHRPQAIYLLRRVREIEPWRLDAVLDLAGLLARTRQGEEAARLLEGLASRCQGSELRRVRATELRLFPGPRRAWRWLRAAGGHRHGAVRAPQPRRV